MTAYHEPDQAFIMEQLKKAGADSNTQVAGAFWIVPAVRGIGRPSLTAAHAKKREQLHQKLKEALDVIDSMDELDRTWFSETYEVIAAQERLMGLVVMSNRGGHREKSHQRFIEALRRFFISEGLQITLSESSPFVLIVSHCIRSDSTCLDGKPETAKRIISRLYKSVDLRETSEEKALRDAEEEAYRASIRRLNDWRGITDEGDKIQL